MAKMAFSLEEAPCGSTGFFTFETSIGGIALSPKSWDTTCQRRTRRRIPVFHVAKSHRSLVGWHSLFVTSEKEYCSATKVGEQGYSANQKI